MQQYPHSLLLVLQMQMCTMSRLSDADVLGYQMHEEADIT